MDDYLTRLERTRDAAWEAYANTPQDSPDYYRRLQEYNNAERMYQTAAAVQAAARKKSKALGGRRP